MLPALRRRPPGPRSPREEARRTFWWDGILISLSDSFATPFVVLFALALGATAGQIGLLASLGSLLSALALLPGARLVERRRRRKRLVVGFARLAAGLAFLAYALIPLIFGGAWAIYAVIAIAALRALSTSLATPAWTSLAASLVPPSLRGRYFASRNIAKGVAALITIPVAAQIISHLAVPAGYQVVFILATAAGIGAAYVYSKLPDPIGHERAGPIRFPRWENLKKERPFLSYCAAAALLHFSVQIVAPYFNVHMVRNLGLSVAVIGLLSTLTPSAALLGQRFFGSLVDRRGNRWVMLIAGLFIALTPWLWIPVSQAWHIAPLLALAGMMWAGYELGAFNLLLLLSPEDRRSRRVAFYHTVVAVAAAAGPLVGGRIFELLGFGWTAFLSGAGRGTAILLLLWLVREPVKEWITAGAAQQP